MGTRSASVGRQHDLVSTHHMRTQERPHKGGGPPTRDGETHPSTRTTDTTLSALGMRKSFILQHTVTMTVHRYRK